MLSQQTSKFKDLAEDQKNRLLEIQAVVGIPITDDYPNGPCSAEISGSDVLAFQFYGYELNDGLGINCELPSLTPFKKLRAFHAPGNRMTGNVEVIFAGCTELMEIRIDGNLFAGNFPFEKCPSLQTFTAIGCNLLSGDVSKLPTSIKYFRTDGSRMYGVFPNLHKCSDLIELTVNGNYLETQQLSENIAKLNTMSPGWLESQGVSAPFGEYSTPVDGTPAAGSIVVSGWALSDVPIQKIKIYKLNDDDSLIYIGDATLVEGARPDVAKAYSNYPRNTNAGWGYMLLTNFLPGGDGQHTLIVKAIDVAGHSAVLGEKTIIVDNAYATKPFGAIDTPAQGGTASGSQYRSCGWTLAPAASIGSINVYIDGVYKGHVTYGIRRQDVANLFPGYANTDYAGGYFDFDTAQYANGVHTIFWIATDSDGNSEGIGSRYFNVNNPNASDQQAVTISDASNYTPSKTIVIHSHQLERVVVPIGEKVNSLTQLQIGATVSNGTLYWTPGPGFAGEYSLLFSAKSKIILVKVTIE